MTHTSRHFLDFYQIYKLTLGSSLRMEKLIATKDLVYSKYLPAFY